LLGKYARAAPKSISSRTPMGVSFQHGHLTRRAVV